ncbi:MAG: hypothetical protein GXO47_11720 [Chlorobi bacterium]|nr:hypothetical protein [Chlorobiota bacterium]
MNVLFLHHSTGKNIYNGGVKPWFDNFNSKDSLKINFFETYFPTAKKYKLFGYGWRNYPYDYYNIWVKHGNKKSYKEQPTLKTLAPLWDVIIFKHCFPVSAIVDGGKPDIDSSVKTLANYKLQYNALKKKLHEYPDTKFILWTGAALTEKATKPDRAKRAKEFFDWVRNEWDEPNDNIYLWDFYELETEGGLYLKNEFARSLKDSHPAEDFSAKVAPLFCQRVVDVIKNDGSKTYLTGVAKVVEENTTSENIID